MAVRIRLTRVGKRNRPYYRIGIYDARTRRNGRAIETVGTYHPLENEDEKKVTLKEERIKYWLGVGAQPTEKVGARLKKKGLV